MRIKFVKPWDYAHDGVRVVRYQAGQIVDCDKEKVDGTFAEHCVERDKVAVIHDADEAEEVVDDEEETEESKARKDKIENKKK